MCVAAHPKDIVYATTDHINESPNHSRKDNIVDFARGTLLIDVAGRQYESEVVIGFTKSVICELHDIVNLKPTKFEYKKETVSKGIDSNESTRSDTTSKHSIPNSAESVNKNSSTQNDIKQRQFEIIKETNPMWDDYHTGIRTLDDIRTWEEVLELNDEREGQFVWGDFSRKVSEHIRIIEKYKKPCSSTARLFIFNLRTCRELQQLLCQHPFHR